MQVKQKFKPLVLTPVILDVDIDIIDEIRYNRLMAMKTSELSLEQQLSIVATAWERVEGYCFFPWISGSASTKADRIANYHEGEAYLWPQDKPKILKFLSAHTNDDVYWCPSLFEHPRRRLEFAMDEHCLWADLDEKHPKHIEHLLRPTIAWETSPGRYQALWLFPQGFSMQGASWPGRLNQRLTYYLEADQSGWDTTQLLRLPGWKNFKPDRRQSDGTPSVGRLLWNHSKGPEERRYFGDEFEHLPEIPDALASDLLSEAIEGDINQVKRNEVLGRVRLRISKEVNQLIRAHTTGGGEDRSAKLWQIERDLADAGCGVAEIVAIARETVWNKYTGRSDELKRLISEASKAIAQATPREWEGGVDYDKPQNLFSLLRGIRPPDWMVEQIWTTEGMGFIAGQPKSYKSWIALDLALSISTGLPFLSRFTVLKPGPVLYVQEEDSAATVKGKVLKIWKPKREPQLEPVTGDDGKVRVMSTGIYKGIPSVNATIRNGYILSDPGWQEWLDEILHEGYNGIPYAAVIFDPLMAMMGDVDENKATQVNNAILMPLRELNTKHHTAFAIVHHMRKTQRGYQPEFGGVQMLGSQAYHAWAEDALYLTTTKHGVRVERWSKSSDQKMFTVSNLHNDVWEPHVSKLKGLWDEEEELDTTGQEVNNGGKPKNPFGQGPKLGSGKVYQLLQSSQVALSVPEMAEQLNISKPSVYQQLKRLHSEDLIVRLIRKGKSPNVFKVK